MVVNPPAQTVSYSRDSDVEPGSTHQTAPGLGPSTLSTGPGLAPLRGALQDPSGDLARTLPPPATHQGRRRPARGRPPGLRSATGGGSPCRRRPPGPEPAPEPRAPPNDQGSSGRHAVLGLQRFFCPVSRLVPWARRTGLDPHKDGISPTHHIGVCAHSLRQQWLGGGHGPPCEGLLHPFSRGFASGSNGVFGPGSWRGAKAPARPVGPVRCLEGPPPLTDCPAAETRWARPRGRAELSSE